MPAGEWVQTTLAESIVGVHHRKANAVAFARAARKAEARSLVYGLELEHHPGNRHDPNAIAVFGVAEQKRWFRRTVGRWHIGYLDRDVAADIVDDLVSKGIPVAAELYSIYEGNDGFLDFKVIVLALAGYGTKARQRARRRE
jgi:HIRAN domain